MLNGLIAHLIKLINYQIYQIAKNYIVMVAD